MKTTGNVVLITGGATGIGFAMAEEFVRSGNEVIICGRREARLKEAKEKLSGIHVKVCDISKEKERQALYKWVSSKFKGVNVLVNNAGIQRPLDMRKGVEDLLEGEDEIAVNLTAPIVLSAHFIPLLLNRKEAAIINVSSGLGFVPLALFPVYCATKAAMHSFSISLRHQLKGTPIHVFEVIPPIVDTELDKGRRSGRGMERGIPAREVAKEVMDALKAEKLEIPVGWAQRLVANSRKDPEAAFAEMNED